MPCQEHLKTFDDTSDASAQFGLLLMKTPLVTEDMVNWLILLMEHDAGNIYDNVNNQTATAVCDSIHSAPKFIFEPLVPADTKHPQAHPLYWADMKRAHGLVAELRRINRVADDAPMYVGGYFDEEYGDILPEDNLEPYEKSDEFFKQCLINPAVCRILRARGRLDSIEYEYWL
ncbi:MAG: hypothetical protein GY833_06755 [Aestuariibacter sp.]|nr:hypothetical protein [Aestuariibacter sp.]